MLKRKDKLLVIILIIVVAALIWIMWRQSHLDYTVYLKQSGPGADSTAEGESSGEIIIPETYTEKVNDRLYFDAKIITGEDFDPNQVYQASARIYFPDAEAWAPVLLQKDLSEYEYEEMDSQGLREIPGKIKSWNDELSDYLRLDVEGIYYWKQPEMNCMSGLFHFDAIDPMNNREAFESVAKIDGLSQQEAWDTAMHQVKGTGVDTKDWIYDTCLAVNSETLNDQQQKLVESGNIEEDDLILDWGEADEGYYYYFYQQCNGLMIYPALSVLDYGGVYSHGQLYMSRSGIYELNIPVLFDVSVSDEVQPLCDFQTIVDTLKNHYELYVTNTYLTVTECRLVEYPIQTGENQYQMQPIWICTTEEYMGDEASNTGIDILAVNAVTGEEMTELGGYN